MELENRKAAPWCEAASQRLFNWASNKPRIVNRTVKLKRLRLRTAGT